MLKDGAEHSIPEPWRTTLRQIAKGFVDGDFQLGRHSIEGVASVPTSAQFIAENVRAYGASLAPLDDETWELSVCRWMDGYWQVLVDLATKTERVSDLTLHAKRYNDGRWEIGSVHVP